MNINIDVEGEDEVDRALKRAGSDAQRALGRALYIEGERIMGESKRLCPVDTGTLRSSGRVQPPEQDSERVVVRMTYGGAAAPYAVSVHENLNAYHSPPTQAKFLEQPALEARETMPGRLAYTMAKELQR